MNLETKAKKEKLIEYLKSLGSVAVAFSGGVDSSFLLKCAQEALGDKAIAVTARSSTYPERELNEAIEFAKLYGIKHEVIVSEELDIEDFTNNPKNRCYLCKSELFVKIKKIADKYNIEFMAEGSNCDDLGDFRPGLQAAKELGVTSPLRFAGLNKAEIRELSHEMGLKSWDKPSFACLSSRIPYGEKISKDKLYAIEQAEQFIMDLGFRQVRVRHHGDIARIELPQADISRIFDGNNGDFVFKKLNALGFAYVTVDIKGYRTGSMNEVLSEEDRKTAI